MDYGGIKQSTNKNSCGTAQQMPEHCAEQDGKNRYNAASRLAERDFSAHFFGAPELLEHPVTGFLV
jgi:hypothetical protein